MTNIVDISITVFCKMKFRVIALGKLLNFIANQFKNPKLSVLNAGRPGETFFMGYMVWMGISVSAVAVGSYLSAFVDPMSSGSGVADVKCYLNGIRIPSVTGLGTLYIKMVGVVCSYVAGLAGGKVGRFVVFIEQCHKKKKSSQEGPLTHAGASIAANLSNGKTFTFFKKKFNYLTMFRDDVEKRDFILGGVAAGVASAFAAPIGGLMFTMEEVASSWSLILVYRALVTSVIGVFMACSFESLINEHKINSIYTGIFNFGRMDDFAYEFHELPIFALMAVAGGLMGFLFLSLSTKCNTFRKRYVKSKFCKVLEAVVICMTTVTIGAVMIYANPDCRAYHLKNIEHPIRVSRFTDFIAKFFQKKTFMSLICPSVRPTLFFPV